MFAEWFATAVGAIGALAVLVGIFVAIYLDATRGPR